VHEQALREAVDRAAARGTLIVSAYDDGEARWLPGSLPGVIPVVVDYTLARDQYRVADLGGITLFQASGFARQIPGVPLERNLHGISLAVANMTGFAARAVEVLPSCSFEAVVHALREGGLGPPKRPQEGGLGPPKRSQEGGLGPPKRPREGGI
jgi:hypothetical protein